MKKNLVKLSIVGLASAGMVLLTSGLAAADGSRQSGYDKFESEVSFEDLDKNGDGRLTKEEFAMRTTEAFAGHDTNGDGFLSADELAAAIISEMGQRANHLAGFMLRKLDDDGDGQIALDEIGSKRRGGKVFNYLDDDGDGVISEEEFESAKDMQGHHGGKSGKGRKKHSN